MFGQGKVYPKQVKQQVVKTRKGPVYWVIFLFVLAIEAMLGINAAFVIEQSVRVVIHNMLDGIAPAFVESLAVLLISAVFGACLMCGGMWVFGWFKDSYEDAKAYVAKTGESNWNYQRLHLIKWMIIALDITTLAFRASFFAERGSLALLAFLGIMVFLPGPLGSMLYVHQHTPRDRRLARARQQAEVRITEEALQAVNDMDSDLLARWEAGDSHAYEEHLNRQAMAREEAYQQQIENSHNIQQKQEQANRPLRLASRDQAS